MRQMPEPGIEAVLLRLTVEGGVVTEVSSTGPVACEEAIGAAICDLLDPCPENSRFVQSTLRTADGLRVAAARATGKEYFVYFLDGPGAEASPGIPWIMLSPDSRAPLASPAMVALLGYTPWELGGTELLAPILRECGSSSFTTSVLDRWGSRRDILCHCTRARSGTRWIALLPLPPHEEASWEAVLSEWEQQPGSGFRQELDFLLKAVGIPSGALLDGSGEGIPSILAQAGLSVTREDLSPGGMLSTWVSGSILWVDSEETPAELGNLCIAPFGRSEKYIAVLGGAHSPVATEQRLKVMLPILAMRLDLLALSRYGAELDGRRALLDDIESIVQKHSPGSWSSLSPALADIAPEIGASALAILAPDGGGPSACAGDCGPGSIAALSTGLGEAFQAVVEVKLREGYRFCAGFERAAAADPGLLKAVGRMLERYCHDGCAPSPGPDLSSLPAVQIRNFRVLWQGDTPGIDHCYEYYGRSGTCDGCPLTASGDERPKRMRILTGDILEEIHPSRDGHVITWTRLPPRAPAPAPVERVPGGTASYDADGIIESWSGWLEAAAGVPAQIAIGQWAGRLLDKLGSDRLIRQFELALRGVFLPESVEFLLDGRRCGSRMTPGPDRTISHFILDSVSAGMGEMRILSGPGIISPEAEPSSLASTISAACEILGWELDISPAASADGCTVWLSQQALSGLLLELLRVLAPLCPERWAALDSSVHERIGRGTRPILPGRYLTLQFGIYPVLLATQTASLLAIDREIAALGGWTARNEQGDNLTIALPSSLRQGDGESVGFYANDDHLGRLVAEIEKSVPGGSLRASTLAELAGIQQECRLIVARLRPQELELAAALAGRAPWQGILIATGLQPRIPLFASRIELLQLPATPEELLGAVRRMLVR